ncbi:MAG: hypothetical protein PHF75_07495 [Gallionella sp.]|nr:hypothetical protein [Gallionella sp.]
MLFNNHITQFAARFELQADGSFVYHHPDRLLGGVLCSREEVEQLIRNLADVYARSLRLTLYWAIGSGIVIGLLEASHTLMLAKWAQYGIILAPVPYAILACYRADQQPLHLLEGRVPITPPRTRSSAFWIRVAALPAGLIILTLLTVAGQAYYTQKEGWEHPDLVRLFIMFFNILFAIIWLYARNRRPAHQKDTSPYSVQHIALPESMPLAKKIQFIYPGEIDWSQVTDDVLVELVRDYQNEQSCATTALVLLSTRNHPEVEELAQWLMTEHEADEWLKKTASELLAL